MTGDPLKIAGGVVESLGSALRSGEHGLTTAPKLLLRTLREGSWREFVTQRGEQVRHEQFDQFVTTPPLKGLGATPHLVDKIVEAIEDDAERAAAQDLLDAARKRPTGRPKGSVSNSNTSRPTGTTQAAALRRLRKDAPELHAEVLAGRLSAHAAMVQAGFRRKTVSVPVDTPEAVAKALRKNLKPEDIAALVKLLNSP